MCCLVRLVLVAIQLIPFVVTNLFSFSEISWGCRDGSLLRCGFTIWRAYFFKVIWVPITSHQGVPTILWGVPGHHPGDWWKPQVAGALLDLANLRLYEVTFAGLRLETRIWWHRWVGILESPEKNMDRVRKVLVAYSQRNGGDCFKGYTCSRVVRCSFSGENEQYIQTYFVIKHPSDVAVLGSNTNHFAKAWPTLRCQDFNECVFGCILVWLYIWFLILGRMYETYTQRQTHTHTYLHTYMHTRTHT